MVSVTTLPEEKDNAINTILSVATIFITTLTALMVTNVTSYMGEMETSVQISEEGHATSLTVAMNTIHNDHTDMNPITNGQQHTTNNPWSAQYV